MTFATLLIHTCDIGSLSQGVADAYGIKAQTWPVTLPTQPCRLMPTTGREIMVGAKVVISDWKLFVEVVDVDEQDRISNIIEVDSGVVIDAGPFEVIHVQPRRDGVGGHHLELALQKVV